MKTNLLFTHLATETRAGHGAGKLIDKTIKKTADVWAFAAYWMGMKVK